MWRVVLVFMVCAHFQGLVKLVRLQFWGTCLLFEDSLKIIVQIWVETLRFRATFCPAVWGVWWSLIWLCCLWDISLGSLSRLPSRSFLQCIDIQGHNGTNFQKKLRFDFCLWVTVLKVLIYLVILNTYSYLHVLGALSMKLLRASRELAARGKNTVTNIFLLEYVPYSVTRVMFAI